MAGRSLDLTGMQKAAILFIVVGPERASKVFKFLKDDEASEIAELLKKKINEIVIKEREK